MISDAYIAGRLASLDRLDELRPDEQREFEMLVEIRDGRARAAMPPPAGRVSNEVLASAALALGRDHRLMVGADMTRAEGVAIVAELQARRAARPSSLHSEHLAYLADIRAHLTAEAIPFEAVDAFDALLAAAGLASDALQAGEPAPEPEPVTELRGAKP